MPNVDYLYRIVGDRYDEDDYHEFQSGYDEVWLIVHDAAENYFSDGDYVEYPVIFQLFNSDKQSLGKFKVLTDFEPSFTAIQIEEETETVRVG